MTVAILGGVFGYIDAGLLHVRAYGDYGPLSLFFILVCVVPGLAVLVRRLHDTDRTGWWALTRIPSYLFLAAGTSPFQVGSRLRLLPLPIIILGGVLWLIVGLAVLLFLVSEGDTGPNRFGPDPYGPDALEEVFA